MFPCDLFGALYEQKRKETGKYSWYLSLIFVIREYTIVTPRIAYKRFNEFQDTHVLCKGFISDKN
jgi:hypothetical protein